MPVCVGREEKHAYVYWERRKGCLCVLGEKKRMPMCVGREEKDACIWAKEETNL